VRRYTTRDGLPGDNIYSLFEDKTGDVWIGIAFHTGQHTGLARWKRREDRVEDLTPHLQEDKPATSFAEDTSGAVWIGFGDGRLVRYRNGRFAPFGEPEGVPPGVIRVYFDSADRLWGAADAGGVFRVERRDTDHPLFVRFTNQNGLSSDSVFTLTSDLSGRIYAGTRRGIDRIEPTTGKIAQFTTANGLANNVVISSFRDHNGDLWFGTLNGLSKLTASRNPAPPPAVRITEIRVDNRPIALSDFGETDAGSVQLDARQNHVQISFAGINLDSDLRFQYRIEGSDSEWSQPGAQQSVVFPGFPDGKYRFLVQALNSEDVSGDVAAVSFYVLPPLWQRWWFILIATAGIGVGIWQWQRLRLNRLLEVERLRTRIATDLHDDIGTNLSHIAVLSELARRGDGRVGISVADRHRFSGNRRGHRRRGLGHQSTAGFPERPCAAHAAFRVGCIELP
jgi:Y_Y_Y domain/Histidine kinase/Two component regulator propeller